MDGDGKRMKNVFAEIYIWAIVTLGFGCLVAGSLSVKVATLDPLVTVQLVPTLTTVNGYTHSNIGNLKTGLSILIPEIGSAMSFL